MVIGDQAAHRWDVGRLSRALGALPALTHDATYGQGLRYGLGENASLVVELFPPAATRSTGVVRLATAELDLVLFKQRMPAIADDELLFRTADAMLSLAASGEMRLFRATD